MSASRSLRVAVVGLGPKGLFALERLLDRLASAPVPPVRIDAFDPHPVPGAGPVYDPFQPDYLLMNFASDQVDLWPAGSRAVPEADQPSFVEWQARRAEPEAAYAPRAQVGRYLSSGLKALIQHAPEGVSITVRRASVTAVRPGDAGWRVSAGGSTRDYDEVLVATGHAKEWVGALRQDWPHTAPLVPTVYPVEGVVSGDVIRPGSSVAIRGFALTFLDAALALTEGRGGRFEPDGDPPHCRYLPNGTEPDAIFPFSRTGVPVLAKPANVTTGRGFPSTARVDQARRDILALPPGFSVRSDLAPAVVELAEAGARPDGAGDPVSQLVRSLEVAAGRMPVDRPSAVGHAWRAIYPAIVERLGGGGLEDSEWPAFHAVAMEMERVAFGPPAINAAKLAALIRAGIVDSSLAAGGVLETEGGQTRLRSAGGVAKVDAVVDAVLPPPGVIGLGDPLLDQLVGEGLCRVRPGRRGLDVDDTAACISKRGYPNRGLAACGRPTEDAVIGNDTLSRTLHPQLDQWAAGVSERALRAAPARELAKSR